MACAVSTEFDRDLARDLARLGRGRLLRAAQYREVATAAAIARPCLEPQEAGRDLTIFLTSAM